jgi:hypothetical protein
VGQVFRVLSRSRSDVDPDPAVRDLDSVDHCFASMKQSRAE